MKNVIYQITNMVNGKFYIGSAVSFPRRVWAHKNELRKGVHHNKHLQAAWNKYGEDAFVFEVIEEVGDGVDLLEVESGYLKQHFGAAECYNLTMDAKAIGLGLKGDLNPMWGKTFAHTEDAKSRIAAANLGKLHEESAKQAISQALLGHSVSESTKDLLRKARLAQPDPRVGKTHSEETKEVIRQKKLENPTRAWLGKTRSEETKAKISATQKGRPNKMKGKRLSAQGRANIAAAVKRGEESHFYGKRPLNADALQKSVVAVQPDGQETAYTSITALREALGLKAPTVNRALKSGEPIKKGKFAGWVFKYA